MRLFFVILSVFFVLSCGNKKNEKSVSDSSGSSKKKSKEQSKSSNRSFSKAEESSLGEFVVAIYPEKLNENYKVLDTVGGDLNLDGLKDYIIVFKQVEEENCDCEKVEPEACLDCCPKRIFEILLNNGESNSFAIAKRNENLVYTKCSGGYVLSDPYQRIVIKGAYFSVEHYGKGVEHFTRVTTFKYDKDKNDWFLSRDGGVSFHYLDKAKPHKEKVKTKKDFGVVSLESFNYNE